ncbi:DUF5686 family protein [Chryseobacterium sp. T1]
MKKRILQFLLTLSFVVLFSQSKIIVKIAGTDKVLPQAGVYCDKKLLGVTNTQGELDFKTKCPKITVKHEGYEDTDVVVDKLMETSLEIEEFKTSKIEGVVIENKTDPRALAILEKVNAFFKRNSPKSLESYSFKSYEKISYDFDEDSVRIYNKFIDRRADSLKQLPSKDVVLDKKKKKDSLEDFNVMSLMKDSKLFLWERANEYLYSQKYGEKINVLDNRISGLKEPIYQLLALRSNRNQIPREILPENRTLYRFFLTDSIEIEGRQNYVIRFRQVDKKSAIGKRRFNGYLYIDQETFAVKKIESNSNKKNEGSITSIWTPRDNKWFLQKENLKLKMGSTSFNNDQNNSTNNKKNDKSKSDEKEEDAEKKKRTRFGNYVYMKVDYFDFKTPIEVKASEFKGYSMAVKNSDGSLMDNFRTDSLTAREKMTYEKIDSVGKKYGLDQKVNVFSNLLRGRIRVGLVDLDPTQIRYSRYEGLRLGMGAKLNERFNKYISPDMYLAYGFKDRHIKYGLGLDVNTTLDYTSFFRAEYFDDVMSSGSFSQNLWSIKMGIMNSGVDLQNDKFYRYKGFRLSYQVDLNNALTLLVSGKRQNEEARFDYSFLGVNKEFTNFASTISLKYSPNSKNIMTPTGKYTFDQQFPEVYFNYEQGVKSLGGEFNYSRFDVLFLHQFRSKLGVTGARLYGGLMTGNAPVWHQFTMGGLDSSKENSLFSRFNLTTYLGFATMEAGQYFNDKFVGYYFTHRIPWYFKSFGKNTSSFDFVYKGTIGDMKNTAQHQFDFKKLDHLYQEVGLEYNNFLSTGFNLGLFYRVGHYATGKVSDNFAIQLKLKVLGF